MKELKVGQKVWVTTRNRRLSEEDITEFTVSKIGSKYFELEGNRNKFHLDTFQEKTEYTPTYTVYLNKQDYLDKREHERLSDEIRKKIGQWGKIPLTFDKVKAIHNIIQRNDE